MATQAQKDAAQQHLKHLSFRIKELEKILAEPTTELDMSIPGLIKEAEQERTGYYVCGVSLEDRDTANAYLAALGTFMKLRTMPGAAPASTTEYGYAVEGCGVNTLKEGLTRLRIDRFRGSVGVQAGMVIPCFSSYQYAENAIAVVGEHNILHMLNTFGTSW